MDDPLILNFAREYRAVNDIVECSRAHEARISIIAGKVLLKFVEKTKKCKSFRDEGRPRAGRVGCLARAGGVKSFRDEKGGCSRTKNK